MTNHNILTASSSNSRLSLEMPTTYANWTQFPSKPQGTSPLTSVESRPICWISNKLFSLRRKFFMSVIHLNDLNREGSKHRKSWKKSQHHAVQWGRLNLQDIFVMKKEIERIVTCKSSCHTFHLTPKTSENIHTPPTPCHSQQLLWYNIVGIYLTFHLLKVGSVLVNISTYTRDSPRLTDISEAVSLS